MTSQSVANRRIVFKHGTEHGAGRAVDRFHAKGLLPVVGQKRRNTPYRLSRVGHHGGPRVFRLRPRPAPPGRDVARPALGQGPLPAPSLPGFPPAGPCPALPCPRGRDPAIAGPRRILVSSARPRTGVSSPAAHSGYIASRDANCEGLDRLSPRRPPRPSRSQGHPGGPSSPPAAPPRDTIERARSVSPRTALLPCIPCFPPGAGGRHAPRARPSGPVGRPLCASASPIPAPCGDPARRGHPSMTGLPRTEP